MSDILDRLSAPFSPDAVEWRLGTTTQDKTKGMALAYIDSRAVQDRFNEVCGLEWQVRHPWSVGTKLACEIGVKVGDEWLWRGDGAGDSDVEAEKGAFSDSFKRAAVRWGVGRYLYDLKSPWVKIEPRGKSYIIAASEYAVLRKILGTTTAPDHAADIREKRCNEIIDALRNAHDMDELTGLWKHYQGDILVMPPEMLAAVTKAKDDAKGSLTKKAA